MTTIENFREKISKIDDQLIALLVQRFHYAYIIGLDKKKQNIPIVNPDVMKLVSNKYKNALGVYGEEIYKTIHDISVKIQSDETNNL